MLQNKNINSGSAIIYILIGVVLFGLLIFSFTRNSGFSSSIGAKGNASAAAAQIMEFSNNMAVATDKMIASGVSENAISYQTSQSTLNYTNANCTTDSCKIFTKVNYLKPDPNWFVTYDFTPSGVAWMQPIYKQWYITSSICVANIGSGGWTCGGTAKEYEIILMLAFLKKDICNAINKALGFGTATPTDTGDSLADRYGLAIAPYTGTFSAGTYGSINTSPPGAAGAISQGCYLATSAAPYSGGSRPPDGTYTYFKVLLAR